jgi:hypothetical protein
MLLAIGQQWKPANGDVVIKIHGNLQMDHKEFKDRNLALLNELNLKEVVNESK